MDRAVLREFVRRVEEGELGDDLQIRYRVAGGMPGQRLESVVVVDSVNGARVERADDLAPDAERRITVPPDDIDVPELLRAVGRGLPALVPVGERFIRRPDSLVGRLTVVVSGAEESFHVVPEPVKRPPDAGIGPALDRALGQLWELATGGSPTEGGQTSA